MMDNLWILAPVLGGGLLLWTLGAAATGRHAVENARYTVLKRHASFELRSHPAHVTASFSTSERTMKAAGSVSFRFLAGFIFGKNEQSASIAMTSPVGLAPTSEGHTVTFVLPSKFSSLEQVPAPLDSRVRLALVPAGLSAVRRLHITWRERLDNVRFREEAAALLRDVEAAGLRPAAGAQPLQLSYDPPWCPFWMRRDEVSVPLESSQ
jgi:hypothetical protein